MKSSVLLATTGAVLAVASPLGLLGKRFWHTDIVIVVETVTVTEGETPATMFGPGAHHFPTTSTSSTTSSTSSIEELSTSTPEPTPTPEPTTETPTPTPTPTTEAAAEVTIEAEPVVETPATSAQASATTQAAAVSSSSDYASLAVSQHNLHRYNNSAPAVSYDETLASYAAATAAKCVFAHDMTEGTGNYGQNLAMWASSGDAESLGANTALAQSITDMWYNGEINSFPESSYGQPNPDFTNFESWGHYSQLIWVASTSIGCHSQYCAPGTMYSDMGAWFTVCNYSPAGNMGGEYGENVLPPLGGATVVV